MSRDPAEVERFEQLFDANFDDVWRFARRRCASSADADDVASQVFAVAWRRRDEVTVDVARLWLFGVARHVLANHHRSGRRAHRLELRLASEPTAANPPDSDSTGSNSTGSGEPLDDRSELLREAIDGLSEPDREVIVMRYWDGLAVHEIATLLGRTPNAVSIRLHKTRHRLLESVRRKDPPPDRHVPDDSRHRNEDDDELA